MCGRFAHYRTAIEYLEALRADVSDFQTGLETRPIGRYNVAPGTHGYCCSIGRMMVCTWIQ